MIVFNPDLHGPLAPVYKIDFTKIYVYNKGEVILNGIKRTDLLNVVLGSSRFNVGFQKVDESFVIDHLKNQGFIVERDIDESGYKKAVKDREAKMIQRRLDYLKDLAVYFKISGHQIHAILNTIEKTDSDLAHSFGQDLEDQIKILVDFVMDFFNI